MTARNAIAGEHVEEIRRRLAQARREIHATVATTDEELATLEAHQPGNPPEDLVTETASAILSRLEGREKHELDEIDAAQARLAAGAYGTCEGCRRPIPLERLRDIMTANPLSIEPEAPVAAAIDVMVERKIRHLPVVDEHGAGVGIITDRDLRSAALAPALEEYLSVAARRRLRGIGAVLENLRVKDAMTCSPVTTTPGVAVTQAAALMLERHVGSLPVIDNGKLVGIVTDRDAVKALARQVPALRRLAAG